MIIQKPTSHNNSHDLNKTLIFKGTISEKQRKKIRLSTKENNRYFIND